MIETNRCRLTKINEEDYEDVKKIYANHQVRRYLGGIIEDEVILRKKYSDILKRSFSGAYYWVIRSKTSNEFIGLTSLEKYHDHKSIEVSYEFLPQWWGAGYATEVISKLIDYGFNELGLDNIVAETQTANGASCKLLERVGMILESKLHRFGAEQAVYRIKRK
jgi:[ribosomal protein S5]-alanine N-acetyltransferase